MGVGGIMYGSSKYPYPPGEGHCKFQGEEISQAYCTFSEGKHNFIIILNLNPNTLDINIF